MITFAILARQMILSRILSIKLTPFLRYSCKLFVAPKRVNSFAIKQIQTLSAKYRGATTGRPAYGVPTAHHPPSAALCFHILTNPSRRNPFVCTSIQNPLECHPPASEQAARNAKSFTCRFHADFAANPFIYRIYTKPPGGWVARHNFHCDAAQPRVRALLN